MGPQRVGRRLAAAYRSVYESGSDADLGSVPYYEALRCLLELDGVVSHRTRVARGGNIGESGAVARGPVGKDGVMKVRNSLKSLKHKDGSVVVRRRGRTFIVNKLQPRWKARQG